MAARETLSLGVVKKLFDADATAAPVNGTEYAIPQAHLGKTITYTTKFATAPDAVSIKLQGSLNGSDWFDLDESTATAGELTTLTGQYAINFIRARKASQTNGGALTVEVIVSARG